MSQIQYFLSYWRRAKERTFRVCDLVPPSRIEWSPGQGAMTFGDIVRHLAVIERWMFVETLKGQRTRYVGHGTELARGLDDVLAFARSLHAESLDELRAVMPHAMNRQIITPAGASVPAWNWVRAMTEHEAHHRGQLYLMLRLVGVSTPPLFGLTAEQLRALAIDLDSPQGHHGIDPRRTPRRPVGRHQSDNDQN